MTDTMWRFTYGGNTLHAITDIPYMRAACGLNVWETCDWLGDQNTAERERAAGLKRCRTCAKKAGA